MEERERDEKIEVLKSMKDKLHMEEGKNEWRIEDKKKKKKKRMSRRRLLKGEGLL